MGGPGIEQVVGGVRGRDRDYIYSLDFRRS